MIALKIYNIVLSLIIILYSLSHYRRTKEKMDIAIMIFFIPILLMAIIC